MSSSCITLLLLKVIERFQYPEQTCIQIPSLLGIGHVSASIWTSSCVSQKVQEFQPYLQAVGLYFSMQANSIPVKLFP